MLHRGKLRRSMGEMGHTQPRRFVAVVAAIPSTGDADACEAIRVCNASRLAPQNAAARLLPVTR
jgi:hypothetical protein